MRDFCDDIVKAYCSMTGEKDVKLASTPFPPDGSITTHDYESKGELNAHACSLVMKILWIGRLARPDLKKPPCDLSRKFTKWSKADDIKLRRLVGYIKRSRNFMLKGWIGDAIHKCRLVCFCDADFAVERPTWRGPRRVLAGR